MQETKDTLLFTELTAEESASVNGAHGYGRRSYHGRRHYYSRYHHRPYYSNYYRRSSYYGCY
jgi:hypothetical protein